MNLDDLFDQAARFAEPDVPPDVLGGVRQVQAKRRRRQLVAVPLACLVIAISALTPALLLDRGERGPATPPATAPPTTPPPSTPEPTAVVGVSGDHAVRIELPSGARTDLGPAHAVTLHAGQLWRSRPGAACDDAILTPTASFDARGEVPALEVSPDGRTLAFVREAGPASVDYPDMPCARRSLVLRDLATGVERSWSADDGSLWGLSWSADSRQLAYTFNSCCGDYSPEVHLLDITAAPGNAYDVPSPPGPTDGCTNDTPVFSSQGLLLLVRCPTQDGNARDSFELRDGSTGTQVMTLPPYTATVTADASGQHLLALVSSPTPSWRLYAIRPHGDFQLGLSQALADPHW